MLIENYQTQTGEIANYVIDTSKSYREALVESIDILDGLLLISGGNSNDNAAILEVLDGYRQSLSRIDSGATEEDSVYTQISNLSKVHKETGRTYIFGFVISKEILVKGVERKPTKSKAFTQLKDKYRKLTPVSKYRQFILG